MSLNLENLEKISHETIVSKLLFHSPESENVTLQKEKKQKFPFLT
jgi:hypothetical protein